MRSWYAGLRAEADRTDRGHAVLSHAYRVLRAVLTTAVEDDLLPRNPGRITGAGTDHTQERRLPIEQEIWALVDATPQRYRALVWLAAATAPRSAELSGLRRCDVDLLHRLVHVRQTYVEPSVGPRTSALRHFGTPALRSPWPAAASCRCRPSWCPSSRSTCPATAARGRRGATMKELMALAGHSSPRAALVYQHAAAHRAEALGHAVSRLLERPRAQEDSA